MQIFETITKQTTLERYLNRMMDGTSLRWRSPLVFWFLLVCTGLLLCTNVFQMRSFSIQLPLETVLKREVIVPEIVEEGYFIKTKGCRIPSMEPFDKSILSCLEDEKRPVCNDGLPFLVDSNATALFVVNSSLVAYNVQDLERFSCCYQNFSRQNPEGNERDHITKYEQTCVRFNDLIVVTDEFVRVTCKYGEKKIYTDFFSFVPIKEAAIAPPDKALSVLMVGIDSISRLNLLRQMPKTVSYLEELNSVELHGYNKVGDNTFPNLIPVFTGLSVEELEKSCWPDHDARFDDCPFIWKNFKNQGFSTVYAEDSAWMGMFHYSRMGFLNQPTDYFWSAFNREAEDAIGNQHVLNCDRCVGSRQVYKTLIDYLNRFTKAMQDASRPFFGFFWEVPLAHDFLNTPKWGDDDYAALLRDLKESGRLEDTILIFMSDHGIRWGSIRYTYQGRVEERMPFVHLVFPEKFRREHTRAVANVVKNKHRLTTPFDLHETLLDLLNPHTLTPEFLERRIATRNSTHLPRGYSLFDKIPGERTCESAGIASHWCLCQQSSPVNVTEGVVVAAANFAVEYMNDQLEGYAECAVLGLDAILNAQLQTYNEDIVKDHAVVDYTITLRTMPGGGVFETTVRKLGLKGKDYEFEVMGTISRINLYGKQSLCITDFHLKLYCYCKGFVDSKEVISR